VPIPFRADLQRYLEEFIEEHRGVRPGTLFGVPAGYAGRRLFACVIEDGIIVRLPQEIATRELKGRGTRFSGPGARTFPSRPGPLGTWVMYRPRTGIDARRLTPLLELAARNVAERQSEDLTGVRSRRK
jgi:hypothetical protein